jgi:hypothetical protein
VDKEQKMSSIPPSNMNLVTGIVQTTVSQRQRAVEKDSEKNQQAQQAKEQSFLSDEQEHKVEDTLQLDDARVRKHDEEESHQQRKHRHRNMPEDQNPSPDNDEGEKPDHIDLQA